MAARASLTVQDATLQGGVATQGGAVFNRGVLTLRDVTVQSNTAQGPAGGPGWGYNLPGGDAAGGGIYSSDSLLMERCTVRNNTAVGGRGANAFTYSGGGFEPGTGGKVTAAGSDGGDAFGGGVYVGSGTATITGSDINTNAAKGGAGGNQGGSTGRGYGGGLYLSPTATVFLDPSTRDHVKKNIATTSGNDIYGTFTLYPT